MPLRALAARGKSPDRPCARDLASAGKARRGGDARASSSTSNAGGGKPLAPFGLPAAHTRLPCCGSSMMLGHHPPRRASYPAPRSLQHGLSVFCHGLLEAGDGELPPIHPRLIADPHGSIHKKIPANVIPLDRSPDLGIVAEGKTNHSGAVAVVWDPG